MPTDPYLRFDSEEDASRVIVQRCMDSLLKAAVMGSEEQNAAVSRIMETLRYRRRMRRLGYAAGIAWLLAAGIVMLTWHYRPPVELRGHRVSVKVLRGELIRPDQQRIGQGDYRIPLAERLKTREKPAEIRLRDGTLIRIGAWSTLVPIAPGGKIWYLYEGKINVAATHQDPNDPLYFETPHCRAAVIGTKFTLDVSECRALLTVDEGIVKIHHENEEAAIFAGYGVETGPGIPLRIHRTGKKQTGEILWYQNLPIYEARLSNMSVEGTLTGFRRHLPRLAELDVGIVSLLPVMEHGQKQPARRAFTSRNSVHWPIAKKDWVPLRDGLFGIRNYRRIDPRYGTAQQFRDLVKAIHEQNMYIILDVSLAHTSWDADLLRKHPEFYVHEKDGSIRASVPWLSVARLDYRRRGLWNYMAETLTMWLQEFDVDGFAMTNADRVPLDFWNWLIPRLRQQKPRLILIAQGLEQDYAGLFDMCMDTRFARRVLQHHPVEWLRNPMQMIRKTPSRNMLPQRFVRYISNRDLHVVKTEPSGAHGGNYGQWLESLLQGPYGKNKCRQLFLLTTLLPDTHPLIWNGQEIGLYTRTNGPIPWNYQQEDFLFYRRLFQAYRKTPALYLGKVEFIDSGNSDVVFIRRKAEHSVALAVFNGCDREQTVSLPAAAHGWRDVLQSPTVFVSDECKLAPWEGKLFVQ